MLVIIVLVYVGGCSLVAGLAALNVIRADRDLARTMQQRKREFQANHSTNLPRTTQDIGEPVTFRATASDVTDRVFGNRRHEQYDRDGNMYDNSSSAFPSWMGGAGGRAVHRVDDEEEGVRDPDLPRYGESV